MRSVDYGSKICETFQGDMNYIAEIADTESITSNTTAGESKAEILNMLITVDNEITLWQVTRSGRGYFCHPKEYTGKGMVGRN